MAQGLAGSVIEAYAGFRDAQARQEHAASEPRILFYAFLGGFLLFLAGLPTVRMQASLVEADNALVIVLSARFFGALFVLPPAFYLIAAVAHLVCLAFGGAGSFLTVRLSLFWAILVTMPILILASLGAILLAQWPGLMLNLLGLAVLLAFAKIWGEGLAQSEKFARSWPSILAIIAIPVAAFLAIASIRS